jgi:hypothetical protein
MNHSHFLLQDWLKWWESLVILWQSGGWQALYHADENLKKSPERDAVNVVTGSGAGAARVSEAFKELVGISTPDEQAPDGFQAERNLFQEWIKELFSDSDAGSDTEQPGSTSRHRAPLEDFFEDTPSSDEAGANAERGTLADFLDD